MKSRSLLAILWIGLIAGSLDIGENLIFNSFRGISPWRVFQYIATGLVGMHSFRMGWGSVWLGVAIHYAIALTWTAIFFLAATRCNFTFLTRRPIGSGLIYGAIVYLVMTFIVLPLSGVPHPKAAITLVSRINAVLALLVCIGVPIALLTRRAGSEGRSER